MSAYIRSKAPGEPAAAQPNSHQLWQEARRSIGYGVLVLLLSAVGFSLFVRSMPPLKVSLQETQAGMHACSAARKHFWLASRDSCSMPISSAAP